MALGLTRFALVFEIILAMAVIILSGLPILRASAFDNMSCTPLNRK
jgi:hypothetical protein